jgi:adenylyltransferase/sulfurtransferase
MGRTMNASNAAERYARQMRFLPLGEDGQQRLSQSKALLCGVGALGSTVANLLVRAGIGTLRIVDRDFVERSNLQRQVLFDEADAEAGLPKVAAAAEKLRRINSEVCIEPIAADIEPANIESFCDGVDLILDGTDNFETRFLMNDVAVKRELPWIYAGCVGAEGQTMTILPGETPCLRCLMPECPSPGSTPTCDTTGILGPIVGVIASMEAMEAMKILSGRRDAVSHQMAIVDLWKNRIRSIDVGKLREAADCPTCKHGEFLWLSGRVGHRTAVLCGRNAVQLSYPGVTISLDALAKKLEGVGPITRNPFLLRLKVEGYDLAIFTDGRTIISGTDDIIAARAIYAKYIGN